MKNISEKVKVILKKTRPKKVVESALVRKVKNFIDSADNDETDHKDQKKRIKKCRHCKSVFGTEDMDVKKLFYPPLKYWYCSHCGLVLANPPWSFSAVQEPFHNELTKIYNNISNKKTIPDSAENGIYKGCPINSARKACTRVWRRIRYLANHLDADGQCLNVLNMYDQVSKKTWSKLTEMSQTSKKYENKKRRICNLNEQVCSLDNVTPLSDDMLTPISINGNEISPLFQITLCKKKRTTLVPLVKNKIDRHGRERKRKELFHDDFIHGGDNFSEHVKEKIEPSKYFHYVCFMRKEPSDKSKNFIGTINKDKENGVSMIWSPQVVAIDKQLVESTTETVRDILKQLKDSVKPWKRVKKENTFN